MPDVLKPRDFVRRHPLATAVGALVLAAAGARLLPQPHDPPPSAPPPPPPKRDETIPWAVPSFGAAQFVGPALKDAASARYQKVTLRRRMGLLTLCGEVSSKNSFGAYEGFTGFVDVSGLLSFEDGGSVFARRWNHWCVMTDKNDPTLIRLGRAHHAR